MKSVLINGIEYAPVKRDVQIQKPKGKDWNAIFISDDLKRKIKKAKA